MPLFSSEVKGKVVLPDEYANFRKALVKAGFVFGEGRDCVPKGCVSD